MSIAIIGVATAGGGALYTLCMADLLARMPPESGRWPADPRARSRSP
jgi:hypothetical protein